MMAMGDGIVWASIACTDLYGTNYMCTVEQFSFLGVPQPGEDDARDRLTCQMSPNAH